MVCGSESLCPVVIQMAMVAPVKCHILWVKVVAKLANMVQDQLCIMVRASLSLMRTIDIILSDPPIVGTVIPYVASIYVFER